MLQVTTGAARGRAGRPALIQYKVRRPCQERACKSARAPAPGKRLCFADSERDDFGAGRNPAGGETNARPASSFGRQGGPGGTIPTQGVLTSRSSRRGADSVQ